jgi:hypothetical protein
MVDVQRQRTGNVLIVMHLVWTFFSELAAQNRT